MEKRGLSQEVLKLIACITMLIDHIGMLFFPKILIFRIIGRLSFPIYCFLLAEGAAYTKNAGRYALRLFLCAVISEIPHDLACNGKISLGYLTVMVSLLIGFGMLWAMGKTTKWWLKLFFIGTGVVLGRIIPCSYGWTGILVMAVFGLTRGKKFAWLVQVVALTALFGIIPSSKITLGSICLSIQYFGVLALIPIWLYSGQKLTQNRWVQWGFYLFYPVHFLVLYLIKLI